MFKNLSLWSPYGSNGFLLFISLRALKTTCIEKWFMWSSEPALKVLDSLRRFILFQRMGQLRADFCLDDFLLNLKSLISGIDSDNSKSWYLSAVSLDCLFLNSLPQKNPCLFLVLLVIFSRWNRFINLSFDFGNEFCCPHQKKLCKFYFIFCLDAPVSPLFINKTSLQFSNKIVPIRFIV